MALGIELQKSVAILIGMSRFPKDARNLQHITAVPGNIADLSKLLMEKTVVGIPDANIKHILDKDSQKTIYEMERFCQKATDALIVYYVGHGIRKDNKLFLAARDTETNLLVSTAIKFNNVGEIIRDSYARKKILVLDCCYSGLATNGQLGGLLQSSLDAILEDFGGTFIITASASNSVAYYKEGERHTKFTGEFINTLQNGIKNDKEYITLHEIYDNIRLRMHQKGLSKAIKKDQMDRSDWNFAHNRMYRKRDTHKVQPTLENTAQRNTGTPRTANETPRVPSSSIHNAWKYVLISIPILFVLFAVLKKWPDFLWNSEPQEITDIEKNSQQTQLRKKRIQDIQSKEKEAERYFKKFDYQKSIQTLDSIFTSPDLDSNIKERVKSRRDEISSIKKAHDEKSPLKKFTTPSAITRISFSPNGQDVASVDNDNNIKIWNLKTPNPTELYKAKSRIKDISYSSDGKYLAWTEPDAVKIYDISNRKERKKFILQNPVKVFYKNKKNHLAYATKKGLIEVRNKKGMKIFSHDAFVDSGLPVTDIAISPNGKYIAYCINFQILEVLEISDKKTVKLSEKEGGHFLIAFSPDSKSLVTASRQTKGAILVDYLEHRAIDDKHNSKPIIGQNSKLRAIMYHPASKHLVFAGNDGFIRSWDTATEKSKVIFNCNHPSNGSTPISTISFSSDGRYLSSGHDNGKIFIWVCPTDILQD